MSETIEFEAMLDELVKRARTLEAESGSWRMPTECELEVQEQKGKIMARATLTTVEPEPPCPVCGKPASERKDGLFCCPHCGGEAAFGWRSANPWEHYVAECTNCHVSMGRYRKDGVVSDWNRRA